jgi:hypothetical protein
VPLGRGKLAIARERILGDLISCQNDGKCSTAIVGKVEIA